MSSHECVLRVCEDTSTDRDRKSVNEAKCIQTVNLGKGYLGVLLYYYCNLSVNLKLLQNGNLPKKTKIQTGEAGPSGMWGKGKRRAENDN